MIEDGSDLCQAPEGCPREWTYLALTSGSVIVWGVRQVKLCGRHHWLHRVLCERWRADATYVPRWRVYAETVGPPW